MLALVRGTSFWPPSMVYISVNNTHITNYNLSHVGPLWAAFMYCICKFVILFYWIVSTGPIRYSTRTIFQKNWRNSQTLEVCDHRHLWKCTDKQKKYFNFRSLWRLNLSFMLCLHGLLQLSYAVKRYYSKRNFSIEITRLLNLVIPNNLASPLHIRCIISQ